jgi:hypothetical protein
MPSSSVSDGVQSLITEKYPGTIYCAVETSGDGAVNFQSRVQMYLFKARKVAEEEYERALAAHGLTREEVREFLAAHPRLAGALHRPPRTAGSTPVDLLNEVAEHLRHSPTERLGRSALASARALRGWLDRSVRGAPATAERTLRLGRELAEELAALARQHGPELARQAAERATEAAERAGEQALAQLRRLPQAAAKQTSYRKAS